MSKISLIIQREYTTRVKKKSFIVMTIIGPILFGAMMVLPGWFASMENTGEKTIAIVDQTSKYTNQVKDTEYLKFHWLDNSNSEAIGSSFKDDGYDAYVMIEDDLLANPDAIKIYSDKQVTIDVKEYISRNLERHLEKEKLNSYEIDGLDNIIQTIHDVRVNIKMIKIGKDGEEKESSEIVVMIAAIFFAMLIYMFVLVYGMQVMRGVMEEKTNRIVEVIVSSVKPFQLMMGKIIGIALVALTQFMLWVILTLMIATGINAIFSGSSNQNNSQSAIGIEQTIGDQQMADDRVAEIGESINNIFDKILTLDLWANLLSFVFYFLGGYLLYASLFAALGAALDNEADSQQFVMPVMMPLILSIYVAMAAFRSPDGDLAFWFSMIPFTSPVVMMARIPFDPPVWQLILSMIILVGTFVFTTWFAGRIYRTGILMYGKKVSYKELWKWFRYSGK
ncbi:ABC transporter permease [Carboxylicivirga marina]|uniref:ABC transporter permease n=1 Tax=Carboxylicivirga marina TaxID=2800988 RepID=A0ABS1HIW1_9BACT|nr:ABC transporter permease [Carboxylicivirga marina]MBK3517492.1 ABC transporter permease [Carboxylicivirga marina]